VGFGMAITAFWTYLKSLRMPSEAKDFVDLFSKTIVAAASAIVALGFYVYNDSQQELRDEKERNRALVLQKNAAIKDAVETDRKFNSDNRDTIALFLSYMPRDFSDPQFGVKVHVLSAYCNGKLNNDVIKPLCEELSAKGQAYAAANQAGAEVAAASAAREGDASAYFNSSAGKAQSVALAARESSGPVPLNDQWFCVVASIPKAQQDAVGEIAKGMARQLAGQGNSEIGIYLTKISKSYAITVGGPVPEAEAKACAANLRSSGAIADAFAQIDREWKKVVL